VDSFVEARRANKADNIGGLFASSSTMLSRPISTKTMEKFNVKALIPGRLRRVESS